MNSVNLLGNLTKDIDLEHTPNGVAVANFRIAVQGRKKDEVDFVDIRAWDKAADFVSTWFGKGEKIAVTGRLKMDNWEDKETGQRRSKLYVVGTQFDFCTSKGNHQQQDQQPAQQPAQQPSRQPTQQPTRQTNNNYVPF